MCVRVCVCVWGGITECDVFSIFIHCVATKIKTAEVENVCLLVRDAALRTIL